VTPTAADEDWPMVARAITDRMRELRLSQQQLAARAGISTATIRVLQRAGGRRAHDETLAALSRALGWPDDYLLAVLLGRPVPVASQETRTGVSNRDDQVAPAAQVYAVVTGARLTHAGPHTAVVYVAFESPAAAQTFARRRGLDDYLISPLVFDTSTEDVDASVPPAVGPFVGRSAEPARSTRSARRRRPAA